MSINLSAFGALSMVIIGIAILALVARVLVFSSSHKSRRITPTDELLPQTAVSKATPTIVEEIITEEIIKEQPIEETILPEAPEEVLDVEKQPLISTMGLYDIKRISNIPNYNNPNFISREKLLTDLKLQFAFKHCVIITDDVSNYGGVGKTQLLLDYIKKNSRDYEVIWWLCASNQFTLIDGLGKLAAALEIDIPEDIQLDTLYRTVKRILDRKKSWLLVFDNVNELENINNLILNPSDGHTAIILDKQKKNTQQDVMWINSFDRTESVNYILNRTKQSDVRTTFNVSESLNDYPLAIEMASAFMDETGKSSRAYLSLIQTLRPIDNDIQNPLSGYPKSLIIAYDVTRKHLEKKYPAAIDLLRLCSFFGNESIPASSLREALRKLPTAVSYNLTSDTFDAARNILEKYSLIEDSGSLIYMHKALQGVVQGSMNENTRRLWVEAITQIMSSIFYYEHSDTNTIETCSKLISHALNIIDQATKLKVASDYSARLLNEIGMYLQAKGSFAEAKEIINRALMQAQETYGNSHPLLAICADNLGSILKKQGDLRGAKSQFEFALEIDEKLYGPNHPNVALRASNLAEVLQEMGSHYDALGLFKRAFTITEMTYGSEHYNMVSIASKLGFLMEETLDIKAAREYYEKALRITESAFGPMHQDVVECVDRLGKLLWGSGDPERAQTYFYKSLRIAESAYGMNHPYVALRLTNLAWVLADMNDFEGAKDCLERALEIDKESYGSSHPRIASRASSLGYMFANMGDMENAKIEYERALFIDEAVYGPEHPKIGVRLNSLAGLYEELDMNQEAKALYARAAQILENSLGSDNAFTIAAQKNLDEIDVAA